MAETVYIVREFNVAEQPDLVAPTAICASLGSSHDYTETGVKVADRVPVFFADRMIVGLQALMEQLGYRVVVETSADD